MTNARRAKATRQAGGGRNKTGGRAPTKRSPAAARRRRRTMGWTGGGVVVAAGLGIGLAFGLGGSGGSPAKPKLDVATLSSLGHLVPPPFPGHLGPENVPVPKAPALASANTPNPGEAVDGIQCDATEQVVYHVHTHLTIFVNGHGRQVPYGIGITPPRQIQRSPVGSFVDGGSCFYWLHTHSNDGIIHIESPTLRTYTLGQFFAVWHQPLSSHQVGPAKGKVTAFYDGKLYKADPATIPIGNHVQIQLDVGRPLIAPESIRFPSGL